MSKLGRLRRKWGWELQAARCGNCKHFRGPRRVLVNSLPRLDPGLCRLGEFWTRRGALCDQWESKEGERLAAQQTRGV